MILVSSRLAGHEVRYDGTPCLSEKIRAMLRDGRAAAVVPRHMSIIRGSWALEYGQEHAEEQSGLTYIPPGGILKGKEHSNPGSGRA
ncbi:hypothetical protein SAMN05880570_0728 [Paenibacillus sp. RU4T]|nr:hypothetical protein SAMN05880555_0729 [Paenibacillus sp. RU4X]SIQ33869.1 hypothetical protein SAMN05880570_0728 [Paenibacillus sp. RU4T]